MDYLYVFYQGSANDGAANLAGQLWYSWFDGTNWMGGVNQIPNLGMSESPAPVAWANGITVFHQGVNNDGQLWYTYSGDGGNWGGDTLVSVLALSGSPSPVVYNGQLYVFHQGGR